MEVAKEAEEADQQAVKEMADAIRTEKVDERVYGSPKNQKGKMQETSFKNTFIIIYTQFNIMFNCLSAVRGKFYRFFFNFCNIMCYNFTFRQMGFSSSSYAQ